MEASRRMRQCTLLCAGTALLLVWSGAAAGQAGGGEVRGSVRGADGLPIAGAQVHLEGQRRGIATNADGRYVIANVPPGTYTVGVEMIGFAPSRREGVVVAGEPVTVDFELRTQVLSLSELVVTGVTEATSRALIPFTVARVGREEMPVPPPNAVGAIQGKVAGAQVITGSQPGSGVSILLRTPTSINRETAPLLVVDGVILGASSADISTLDIESIEVVKGAAAASLYGSRAAAGVVQIRTVRGSSLPVDRTRFSMRSEYGTSDIPRPIAWARYHNLQMNSSGEFLNAQGAVVPRHLAATTRYGFQDQAYPGTTYNHIETLFRPGDYYTNSATFGFNSGGTSWLATVSNQNEMGVVRENDGYQRTDFRLNLDHRLRNDLSLSVSTFHLRSVRDNMYGNVFFDFIHQAPDVNLLQPDPDGTKYIFQPDPTGIRANPLYQIATQDRKARRLRTMGSADLRYNPLSWAAFDVNLSYDRSDRKTSIFIPKGVKTPDFATGDPGFASRNAATDDALNGSLSMSVVRDFGPLRSRTTVRGSMERSEFESFTARGDDLAVGGIPDLDAIKIPSVTSADEQVRTSGYLLNTDLNWDDRFIVNALVRRDGSSVFGPRDRWHTYYALRGAYRMAEEPWWPIERINEFRVHYSRGTAGGRPNFADQYEVFSILAGGGVSLATLGNKFLRPEHATEQEVGVNVVAFERVSLQLAYATQRTVDQLVNVPLPSLFGFSSQWQNAGTIEGTTYEGTLEARLVQRPNLRWSVTLLGDRSRNTIAEYDRPCHRVDLGYRCAGEQLGMIYTQRFLRSPDDLASHRGGVHAGSRDAFAVNDDGVLVPVGAGNSWRDGVAKDMWGKSIVIDGISYAWGMPFRLLTDAGVPADVKTGDANPDLRWGLSNQVQWGNFSFYGLLDSQIGGHVYNNTKQRMYQWWRHGEEDQAGKPEDRKKPAAYYLALYNANSNIDWFVEDASFVKLREVSVRYRLDPSRIGPLSRLGTDRIMLSLIGRNLYTWTNYTGYDPEIGSVLNRYDSFDYPIYRTLTGSIEITF
jgi:TonB-linked SusC/RagA family outer membrane protein